MSRCRTYIQRALNHVVASHTTVSAQMGRISRQMTLNRCAIQRLQPTLGMQCVRAFSSGGEVSVMKVPSMGDSITEGNIIEWVKQPGEWVDADDAIVSIETDKVSVDVRAEVSGFVEEHLASPGDAVEVGAPLVKIRAGDKPADAGTKAEPEGSTPQKQPEGSTAPQPPKEQQQDPSQGKDQVHTSQKPQPQPSGSSQPSQSEPLIPQRDVDPSKWISGSRTEKRVKMSRMRQRIAQRLKDAQNTNAMLTTFQEVDMSAVMDMRKQYKDAFEKKHGVRLGFMSAFIKAASASLQDIPAVNAVIDGGDIVYRDYVDVSVAVASPRGLVVPVIRNAESLTCAQVEQSLNDLAVKARNDQISMEDMAGGTFTISNGGVFGSMMGTPIINPPQSAILGMHATKMRPVAINGKVEIRPMMYLALTYDHRLIDGREAVTFLCSLRDKIEDPVRFLLDV